MKRDKCRFWQIPQPDNLMQFCTQSHLIDSFIQYQLGYGYSRVIENQHLVRHGFLRVIIVILA